MHVLKITRRTSAIALTSAAFLAAGGISASIAFAGDHGGNHDVWVCHPVNGAGETKTGWDLIRPDQASSHIDETAYPGGSYWKHTAKDGRHDEYATKIGGAWVCPGGAGTTTTTGGTPSTTTTVPTSSTTTSSTPTSSTTTTTVPTSSTTTSSTPTSSTTTTTTTTSATSASSTTSGSTSSPSSSTQQTQQPSSPTSTAGPSELPSAPGSEPTELTKVTTPEELAYTGVDTWAYTAAAMVLLAIGLALVGFAGRVRQH